MLFYWYFPSTASLAVTHTRESQPTSTTQTHFNDILDMDPSKDSVDRGSDEGVITVAMQASVVAMGGSGHAALAQSSLQ